MNLDLFPQELKFLSSCETLFQVVAVLGGGITITITFIIMLVLLLLLQLLKKLQCTATSGNNHYHLLNALKITGMVRKALTCSKIKKETL